MPHDVVLDFGEDVDIFCPDVVDVCEATQFDDLESEDAVKAATAGRCCGTSTHDSRSSD